MKLVIRESYNEEGTTYDIQTNKKYVHKIENTFFVEEGKRINIVMEILSFDIIEINEDNIKIRTYQEFNAEDDTPIEFGPDGKPIRLPEPPSPYEFVIKAGETLVLRQSYVYDSPLKFCFDLI